MNPDDPTPSSQADAPPTGNADRRVMPRPTGALLSLIWAVLGMKFVAEADHFGPGFAPMLVWLASIPVIGIVLCGATIYKIDSYRTGRYGSEATWWAAAVWPLATCTYAAIGFSLIV